jgi:hypothetical protein
MQTVDGKLSSRTNFYVGLVVLLAIGTAAAAILRFFLLSR